FHRLRRRLLARGKHLAGLGMVELAERDGLAGVCSTTFFRLLAKQLEYSGDTIADIAGAGQRCAFSDGAVEHARDGKLAAMGSVQGLHHVGDGVASADAEPLGRCRDAWRLVPQRL